MESPVRIVVLGDSTFLMGGYMKYVFGKSHVSMLFTAIASLLLLVSCGGEFAGKKNKSNTSGKESSRSVLHASSSSDGLYTLSVQVSHDDDDAEEELDDGDMYLDSSDLEMSYDGSKKQIVGIRFNDIVIPSTAEIVSAYIQFTADESDDKPTNLVIFGEATADAERFRDDHYNISSRKKTAAKVSYSPTEWERKDATVDQRTPDLSNLVSEIIRQNSWQSGNSMAFLVTGEGQRVADSYDGDDEKAPKLYVQYKLTQDSGEIVIVDEPEVEEPVVDIPEVEEPVVEVPEVEEPVVDVPEIEVPTSTHGSCLDATDKDVLVLEGRFSEPHKESGLEDNLVIDAHRAEFLLPTLRDTDSYPDDPFTIKDAKNVCLSGGTYSPGVSSDTPNWEQFHHSQGIYLRETPNAIIEEVAIINSGDGIRFTEGASDWTFKNSYIGHSGDDAIENDFLYSGLVDDILIDRAYMGMSCRLGSTDRFEGYSPGGTVVIQNSMIALRPQVGTYKGREPGHAGFFKWEYYDKPGCKLVLKNNVFLATQMPNGTGLYLDPSDNDDVDYETLIESSGNIIVWLGKDSNGNPLPYPERIPKGFTLTTDEKVWDDYREKWFNRHPNFEKYR